MDSKEPQPAPESKNPFVIWLNTKEGLNCVQPADFTKPGSVRFLENRLWYAYTAGLSEQLRVSISEISTLQKTIEEQKREVERLRELIRKTHKQNHLIYRRQNSSMTESEITEEANKLWVDFKSKNNL